MVEHALRVNKEREGEDMAVLSVKAAESKVKTSECTTWSK
jgi:hypothetical protein